MHSLTKYACCAFRQILPRKKKRKKEVTHPLHDGYNLDDKQSKQVY